MKVKETEETKHNKTRDKLIAITRTESACINISMMDRE